MAGVLLVNILSSPAPPPPSPVSGHILLGREVVFLPILVRLITSPAPNKLDTTSPHIYPLSSFTLLATHALASLPSFHEQKEKGMYLQPKALVTQH
jgi:hypothetical protein